MGDFSILLLFLALGFLIGFETTQAEMQQVGAMEVYRGNTRLQYTIIDSVKIDSCVIFLNK